MADLLWLVLPNGVHVLLLLLLLSGWALAGRWRRTSPARGWRVTALVLLVAWAGITTNAALANWLVRSLEGPKAGGAFAAAARDDTTLILVLASGELASGSQATPRLDLAGLNRARGGVLRWRQTGGTLLFSGGPDGSQEASIAHAMAALARDMGVPPEAIRLSPKGSTTYEEMRGVADVVRGWSGPRWLVTSASHMPRAQRVADCLGLAMQPDAVDFRQIDNMAWRSWWPDPLAPLVFRAALHEWVGRAVYRVRYGC